MLRLVALPACCAAVLALAACGGGSGKDPHVKEFSSLGCASCHTLKAAGANGHIGPDLDKLRPNAARVDEQITNGGGVMPAFKGKLTAAQIRSLADWVARVAGTG